jgi:hypothetical protein
MLQAEHRGLSVRVFLKAITLSKSFTPTIRALFGEHPEKGSQP